MIASSNTDDIAERRSEVFQILVAAIIIALIMSFLGNIVYGYVKLLIDVYGVVGYVLVATLSIVVVLLCIMIIANMYLGRTVAKGFTMILLVNKSSGEILPSVGYEPGWVAEAILINYRNSKKQLFGKDLPDVNEEVLQELAEVIAVDWFVKSQTTHMTATGRTIRYAVPFPKLGRKCVTLKPSDLIKMFGENRFSDVALMPPGPVPDSAMSVPKGFHIYAYRHEWKGFVISMGTDKIKFYKKLIGGAPGGIEFGLEGSLLNPLKFFTIRMYVDRVAYGEDLFLDLMGLTPVSISEKQIILSDGTIIEGDELEKLREWVEVDYQVIAAYKIRGWLFFHPQFLKVAYWVQAMLRYAEDYFDISNKWDKIKVYQRGLSEIHRYADKMFKDRNQKRT